MELVIAYKWFKIFLLFGLYCHYFNKCKARARKYKSITYFINVKFSYLLFENKKEMNNVKIAVINEVSAADRNSDIIKALEGFDHHIINVGMRKSGEKPELTYIETGFLGAMLINTGRVDLVVGGCGTGQGFLNSIMQYPNIFAGLLQEPLDAWLFGQINGGNCISLALNKGYGWAGDRNLKFIFEKLFSVDFGCGYPDHRRESQKESRKILADMSKTFHLPFEKIIENINIDILKKALEYPGVAEIIDISSIADLKIKDALIRKYNELQISCF